MDFISLKLVECHVLHVFCIMLNNIYMSHKYKGLENARLSKLRLKVFRTLVLEATSQLVCYLCDTTSWRQILVGLPHMRYNGFQVVS